MTPTRPQMSYRGYQLIQKFEGRRNRAYKSLEGPNYAIGYGHTNPKVQATDTASFVESHRLLDQDVVQLERRLARLLTREPTQGQFDALASLAYNIGIGKFGKSSVLKYFNDGDDDMTLTSMGLYNKMNGVSIPGLTRRRQAEQELYQSAERNFPAIF